MSGNGTSQLLTMNGLESDRINNLDCKVKEQRPSITYSLSTGKIFISIELESSIGILVSASGAR